MTPPQRWLVLVHHLPPKPDYLRVKLRRRLTRLGAIPLRNSVYVLPHRAESLEDFQWLAAEIRGDGGDAILCDSRFVDGVTDHDIVGQFNEQANARYLEIEHAAREAPTHQRSAGGSIDARSALHQEHARLTKQIHDAERSDFFGAAGRTKATDALDALRRAFSARAENEGSVDVAANAPAEALGRGRVWVTRAGVFVDRMASAWLIRRFIDPDARFKLVRGTRYTPEPGEVRFDMPRGEYTHQGGRCTFEVLCVSFGLDDDALIAIGEIVHDIDLKDDAFGRPETDGIRVVLEGIAEASADDDARLELAARLFDGLFAQYSSRRQTS